MELLEGSTLEELRHDRGGIVPVGEVVAWACAILDVLAAAHARSIIHRDLKPANVFVTKDGRVKVLDFGTAFLWNAAQWSTVTGIGAVIGTPAFMPPEQALGKRADVDARSDLWALGATLYALLSGEPVHDRESPRAQMFASATTPARPLREIAPHVPRAVASVVDRALAFEKSERWEDAESMREALRWSLRSLAKIPVLASVRTGPRKIFVDDAPTLAQSSPFFTLPPPPPPDTLRPIAQTTTHRPPRPSPRPMVTLGALATITAGALAIFALIVGSHAQPRVAAAAPPPVAPSFEPGPLLEIGSLAAPAPASEMPSVRGSVRPPRWLAKYMDRDVIVVHPDEQADPPDDDAPR
jgi:serine/threonine-protein kinase